MRVWSVLPDTLGMMRALRTRDSMYACEVYTVTQETASNKGPFVPL